MIEVSPRNGTLQHVGKFTLFVSPTGQLIVTSGNMRIMVSPDEARGMLDYWLLYARRFELVQPTPGK